MKSPGTASPPKSSPQQVGNLGGEDRQGDAGGESHHDRIGDELDDRAEAEEAHQNQQHAGHEGRHQQPGLAVLLDDAIDDDDEGPRRAADLHAAAAQQRYHEAGRSRP